MVEKLRPSAACIAFSALRSSVAGAVVRALNATLPLDSKVLTSVKPAASNARFRSGMRAFIGLTPRSNAT